MAQKIIDPTKDELTDEAISQFYKAFYESFNDKSPTGDFLFKELKKGKKKIYNKSVRETKVFDDSFVNVLKSAYPSLLKITKEPKKSIRYEQEVVAMEKARKINSDTVRHLASHTQFIKEVKDDGFVVPSKLLTTFAEEELGIYENRFIKTLINRVCLFINKRIELMKNNLESFQADEVRYENEVKYNNSKVEVNIKVRLTNELEEEMSSALKIFNDVESLDSMYKGLKGTPLYQACQNLRDVNPPIMKTNIILHNPDFKIAYNLWLYMEHTTDIGFDVETKERRYKDNEDIIYDMDHLASHAINNMLFRRGTDGYNFKDGRTYGKSTRKLEELQENEYSFNPENVKLDHNEASEYLLSKTSEYFNGTMSDARSDGLSYDMAIKKVYRQMLDVINNIYPDVFDEKYEDLDWHSATEKRLAEAKREVNLLKIITDLKQMDLNKSLKSYKAAQKKVTTVEKRYLKEQERLKQKALREREREKKKLQREKMQRVKAQLKQYDAHDTPTLKRKVVKKSPITKEENIVEAKEEN